MIRKVLLVLFVLALFTVPVIAQEATPEAVVTITPDPETVVRTGGAAVIELLAALFGGLVAGSAGSLGALALLLRSKAVRDFIELAFMSQPTARQQVIRGVVTGGREVFARLDEATDGQPNVDLSPAAPPVVRDTPSSLAG